MARQFVKRAGWLPAVTAVVLSAAVAPPLAAEQQVWKDTGPAGLCDVHGKDSVAWRTCVGAAKAGMPDTELFYAGYWLARSGKYEAALGYLTLANNKDERVLTYIGFATRKLGNVEGAFAFYDRALALNPNYAVARAYLGEAFLSQAEPAKAKAELAEIESRCGKSCAEYAYLANGIARYEAANRRSG